MKRNRLTDLPGKRSFIHSFIDLIQMMWVHTLTRVPTLLLTKEFQDFLGHSTTFFSQTAVTWLYIYTVNHNKRDILFLTITLDNLNRFL